MMMLSHENILRSIFPLPGKTEAAREFAKTVMGPKRAEYAEAMKRQGVTKESWFMQKTPQGDIVIVHFEADDVEKAFEAQAKSKAPFDVWFKQQVKSITGVDLEQPSDEAPPEEIFHTEAKTQKRKNEDAGNWISSSSASQLDTRVRQQRNQLEPAQ